MKLYRALWPVAMLVLPVVLHAQSIVRSPDSAQSLEQRWQWAVNSLPQMDCADGCWIGYSIQRRTGSKADFGRGRNAEKEPSLAELVYGGSASVGGRDAGAPNEVALLFRRGTKQEEITDVRIADLLRPARLNGAPLLWLGRAADTQSIALLARLYGQAQRPDVQKGLIMAVGVQDAREPAVAFLGSVLTGQAPVEAREAAAFWLGQQGGAKALELLENTARSDRSPAVGERAVFAISLIDAPQATDALIDLAKHADNRALREKAIFWLGQQASKKTADALEDVVHNDPDTEIRKKAVFALSRLPAEEAVPRLIEIAKTNPNVEVRKQAIFWLGQSGEPQAVDALAAIARGR